METQKTLREFMHDMRDSSNTEPVCVGELQTVLHYMARLNEQAPEAFKNMLNGQNNFPPRSTDYDRSVTWDDGKTVKFNEFNEVEGFTKVSSVYPSSASILRNKEQRKALGGGKSYGFRYKSGGRQDWLVDFEAKAFWAEDCC